MYLLNNYFSVHTGTAHQANSITSLLANSNNAKRPSSKSELDAASVLANMNQINRSPCSDEMECVVSGSGPEITPHNLTTTTAHVVTKQQIKEENKENVIEQPEEVAITVLTFFKSDIVELNVFKTYILIYKFLFRV